MIAENFGPGTTLPASGTVTIPQLALALAVGPRILGLDDRLSLRAICFPDPSGGWVPFAGLIRLGGSSSREEETVIPAGDLRLIEVQWEASAMTVDDLRTFLNSWAGLVGDMRPRPGFQDQSNVYRQSSRSGWGGLPCWTLTLYQMGGISLPQAPRGPFFNAEHEFFAATLGDAAAQWLGAARFQGETSARNELEVLIPDPRVFIRNVSGDGRTVQVDVEHATAGIPIYCAATWTDYHGNRYPMKELVSKGCATLQLAGQARALELFLIGADAFCYDFYSEPGPHRSASTSVLLPANQASSSALQQLQDALNTGEEERLEFKEWIPIDRRRRKSVELLKVVSAFANSAGGSLFIGVADDLTVVDISKPLREYGGKNTADTETLRTQYAMDVNRIIREGMTPRVLVETEWVSLAGLHVLKVDVGASEAAPHQIVENGEIYVRKGGNCKRATPEDHRYWALRDT